MTNKIKAGFMAGRNAGRRPRTRNTNLRNGLTRACRAYMAVMEPTWNGIMTATGARRLNGKLSARRDLQLLQLATQLRGAGLVDAATQLEDTVARRIGHP